MVAEAIGEAPNEAQKADMTSASAWASQCLLTMRDAKSHMQAVSKARGHFDPPAVPANGSYGSTKAQGGKLTPQHTEGYGCGGKGKFMSGYSSRGGKMAKADGKDCDSNRGIALSKANTRCLRRGRLGHWRGYRACPKFGQTVQKGKGKRGCGGIG